MSTTSPLIRLHKDSVGVLRNRGMNGSVLAQKPFHFKPVSFTSDIDGLKPKPFTVARQTEMFEAFLEDPFRPISYCLVSAPNDGMAKLLAAWMMQYAFEKTRSRTQLPLWIDLMGGFENKYVTHKVGASLLVLNNVGAMSTQPKIEKLRDILETYTDIPKIVVATGCDPYMFFTKFMYLPIHALAYLTTATVRKTIEV